MLTVTLHAQNGAPSRIRTDDLQFTKLLHYRCAIGAKSRTAPRVSLRLPGMDPYFSAGRKEARRIILMSGRGRSVLSKKNELLRSLSRFQGADWIPLFRSFGLLEAGAWQSNCLFILTQEAPEVNQKMIS